MKPKEWSASFILQSKLVRFAGEINHHRIETHFDLYSGEYYSAELLNDEPALQLLTRVTGCLWSMNGSESVNDSPTNRKRLYRSLGLPRWNSKYSTSRGNASSSF